MAAENFCLRVMGVVFLIITLGCLYNFSQVDLGDSNNTPVLFAFGVIVALQLFVIIRAFVPTGR